MKVLKPLRELISLEGKIALITGCAMGIGKAIAYRFAEAGADLELIDINTKGLGAIKKELLRFESEINVHKVDISTKDEIDSLWEELNGKEPDILVNNAGIYPFKKSIIYFQEFLKWICSSIIYQYIRLFPIQFLP